MSKKGGKSPKPEKKKFGDLRMKGMEPEKVDANQGKIAKLAQIFLEMYGKVDLEEAIFEGPSEVERSLRENSVDCSAKNMHNICAALASLQNLEGFGEFAGVLLTAVANEGQDREYTVDTGLFHEELYFLGAGLERATLVIDGFAGHCVGHKMGGFGAPGTIIVKGDAGDYLGSSLFGGEITVEGNAGDSIFDDASGGRVTIKGDAGSIVETAVDFLNELWHEKMFEWEGEPHNIEALPIEALPCPEIHIEGELGQGADTFILAYVKGELVSDSKESNFVRYFLPDWRATRYGLSDKVRCDEVLELADQSLEDAPFDVPDGSEKELGGFLFKAAVLNMEDDGEATQFANIFIFDGLGKAKLREVCLKECHSEFLTDGLGAQVSISIDIHKIEQDKVTFRVAIFDD